MESFPVFDDRCQRNGVTLPYHFLKKVDQVTGNCRAVWVYVNIPSDALCKTETTCAISD